LASQKLKVPVNTLNLWSPKTQNCFFQKHVHDLRQWSAMFCCWLQVVHWIYSAHFANLIVHVWQFPANLGWDVLASITLATSRTRGSRERTSLIIMRILLFVSNLCSCYGVHLIPEKLIQVYSGHHCNYIFTQIALILLIMSWVSFDTFKSLNWKVTMATEVSSWLKQFRYWSKYKIPISLPQKINWWKWGFWDHDVVKNVNF
jgi:hypothetical protein